MEILKLLKHQLYLTEKRDNYQFLHSEYFVLIDKEGRIRSREDDNGNIMGVYDGTSEYEVGLLIDDIKVLMAEYYLAKKEK